MTTFADMTTLILVFFVMLYSMSSLDSEKWKALVQNLNGNPFLFDSVHFTANAGDTGTVAVPELNVSGIIEESPDWFEPEVVDKLAEMIALFNQGQEMGGFTLEYELGDPYVVIRIQDDVLFDPGRAELKPEALPYVSAVADMAVSQMRAGTVAYVDIEGHADERPMAQSGAYQNNEELSFYRAFNTWLNIMDNTEGARDGDFKFSGWGASKPLIEESTETAWAKNRRVEFFIYKNTGFDPAA